MEVRRYLSLIFILFFSVPVFAQTAVQGPEPVVIGYYMPWAISGTSQYSTNAAANHLCWAFVLSNTKTINKVKIEIDAVTGAPSAANTKMDIRADASGFPSGSTTEAARGLASGPSTGINEWTGFTSSLTGGTRYHACLTNASGAPGTDYVRVRSPDVSSSGYAGAPYVFGDTLKWGSAFCGSTDSGASCGTVHQRGQPFLRLEFSDGTFYGTGHTGAGYGIDATDKIYSTTNMEGVRFTTPSDGPGLNIRCVSMNVGSTGTAPSGGLVYKLYTGSGASPTLIDTTSTIPAANVTAAGGWMPACFTTVRTVAANTVTAIMAAVPSATGDSSNYYQLSKNTVENTAGSKALQLFGNLVSTTNVSGTFTDDDQKVHPFVIMPDTNDPFDVAAGGGGLKNLNHVGAGAQ